MYIYYIRIITCHFKHTETQALRISALGTLFQLLVYEPDVSYFEEDHMLLVVRDILVKGLTWKSGKIAAAMRLQARYSKTMFAENIFALNIQY